MNGTHPTADQLDRYRRRAASPAETLTVDAHVAGCDRCFEAVRADAHLTFDELAALADGTLAAHPHLALCAPCRGELHDLRQMREAVRDARAPRRWWPLAAAAMLVLLAGAAWLWLRVPPPAPPAPVAPAVVQTTPAPAPPTTEVVQLERPRILDTLVTEPAVLRGSAAGGAFALHAPVGTVVLDDQPLFRWDAVSGASAYDVAVVGLDRGTVVASGTSTSNSWKCDERLPRGETYAWQVAAETSRGRIVSPGREGGEARFHVAEKPAVEGTTPLERGVSLARMGALDDAERELEAAGADDLLQKVREWRDQRPRPITTNEAQ